MLVSYNAGQDKGPTGTHGVPLAELTKIISGLTVASNLADPSTWFDAAAAIPQ